jgi:hypothetical protein
MGQCGDAGGGGFLVVPAVPLMTIGFVNDGIEPVSLQALASHSAAKGKRSARARNWQVIIHISAKHLLYIEMSKPCSIFNDNYESCPLKRQV